MKMAILADIHGNLPALEAVLADVDREGCDAICVLGDVAGYYPMLNECVELLQERHCAHVIGNHDYYLLTGQGCPRSQAATRCLALQAKTLKGSTRTWLADSRLVETDGREIMMVHGTPEDPLEGYARSLTASWVEALPVKRLFCGHTHVQFLYQRDDRVFCNPGSVGQPRDGIPGAPFAIWDGERVELRRSSYDLESIVQSMKAAGFEDYYYTNLISGTRLGGGIDSIEISEP